MTACCWKKIHFLFFQHGYDPEMLLICTAAGVGRIVPACMCMPRKEMSYSVPRVFHQHLQEKPFYLLYLKIPPVGCNTTNLPV
jgi:hypothetical protein